MCILHPGRFAGRITAGLFLALAVVSLVFFRIVWPALFWPLYALALVALVTLPWRTVRLRLVGLAFFTGAGPVMGVTLLLQWGLLALAGRTPGLTAWIDVILLGVAGGAVIGFGSLEHVGRSGVSFISSRP